MFENNISSIESFIKIKFTIDVLNNKEIFLQYVIFYIILLRRSKLVFIPRVIVRRLVMSIPHHANGKLPKCLGVIVPMPGLFFKFLILMTPPNGKFPKILWRHRADLNGKFLQFTEEKLKISW